MKLIFDARFIRTDFHDGISRYTTELGNALGRLTAVTYLISDDKQRSYLPLNAECIMLHDMTSSREPFTARILNRYKPDVVVSPMQTLVPFGKKFKLILTVHDLIYYVHRTPPPHLPPHIRAGWMMYHSSFAPQRLVLNGADMVAVVSETTKHEVRSAKLTNRPVIVVPNAARDLRPFIKTEVIQQKNPPKNIVYMGAFVKYKNVETLVRMMEFLPGRTLHLLSRISSARKAQLQKIASPDVTIRFYNGVSDEEYARILADDAVLVSASKSEGYGLPLAEALKLGVPAVVSDMPIFYEVAGAGALYADPNSPRDFAAKITALDEVVKREKMSASGKRHIEQFSWDKSANVLLNACKKIM